MADEMSLQEIEKIERAYQHLIDLFTQADLDLREARVANDAFIKAHHMNPDRGTQFEESINLIEDLLSQATKVHNEAVARIAEAKEEAAQREDESEESGQ